MAQSFWTSISQSLGLTTSESMADVIKRHITNLTDPVVDTRRSAAWQLGKLRSVNAEAIEALRSIAEKDESATVRKAAQWALKNMGTKKR